MPFFKFFNWKAVSSETLFGIDVSSIYDGLFAFYNLELSKTIIKTIIKNKIGLDFLRQY